MTNFQRISTFALLLISGFTNIGFGKASSTLTRYGQYRIQAYDDGTCSIYHLHGDKRKDEGVRTEHLEMLEEQPGRAGEVAGIFIDRWFGKSKSVNDDIEPGGFMGLAGYRTPRTDSCERLGMLKEALNEGLTKVKPEPKKSDLLCFSPNKKHRFSFRLNSEGDLEWSLASRKEKHFKSWGHSTAAIQHSSSSDCEMQIRDLDVDLNICIPSEDPQGKRFDGDLKSLEVEGLQIRTDSTTTLTCKASSRLYKSNLMKRALAQKSETDDAATISDNDFSEVIVEHDKTRVAPSERIEAEWKSEKLPEMIKDSFKPESLNFSGGGTQ